MDQKNKFITTIQKKVAIKFGNKLGYKTVKSIVDLTQCADKHLTSWYLAYNLTNTGCKNIDIKGDGFYSAKLLINGNFIDILHSTMNNDSEIAYIDLFKNNVIPFINNSNNIVLEIEHELDIQVNFDIYETEPIKPEGYMIDYIWTQYTGVEPMSQKGVNKIKLYCDNNVDKIYVMSTKPLKEPYLSLSGDNHYPTYSSDTKYVFEFNKKINFTESVHYVFLITYNEESTEINNFVKTTNQLYVKPSGFGMPARLIIDISCKNCCCVKK